MKFRRRRRAAQSGQAVASSKCLLAITCLWLFGFAPCWAGEPLVRQGFFPTAEAMDKADVFLIKPIALAVWDQRLFLLDGGAHQVMVFDRAGALLDTFGEQGEEPGELDRPFAMDVDHRRIYIGDREGHVQFFDHQGGSHGSMEIKDRLRAFVVLDGNLLGFAEDARAEPFLGWYALGGRRKNLVRLNFEMGPERRGVERLVTLKRGRDRVFALQKFDLGYRVIREGRYALKGRVDRSMTDVSDVSRFRHTYPSFAILDGVWLAGRIGKGRLLFDAFSERGQILRSFSVPAESLSLPPDEIIKISDMQLVRAAGEVDLYLAIQRPVIGVLHLRLDTAWWSTLVAAAKPGPSP